jgi:hypothetical protein
LLLGYCFLCVKNRIPKTHLRTNTQTHHIYMYIYIYIHVHITYTTPFVASDAPKPRADRDFRSAAANNSSAGRYRYDDQTQTHSAQQSHRRRPQADSTQRRISVRDKEAAQKGTCWRFNNGDFCDRRDCIHLCWICGDAHSLISKTDTEHAAFHRR